MIYRQKKIFATKLNCSVLINEKNSGEKNERGKYEWKSRSMDEQAKSLFFRLRLFTKLLFPSNKQKKKHLVYFLWIFPHFYYFNMQIFSFFFCSCKIDI